MNGKLINNLLNNQVKIADLGCGKLPVYYYNSNLNIDYYDLYTDNPDIKKLDILTLHNIPELKNLYDVVVLTHVFEHITNIDNLFKTLKHIMKPNGYLYCAIPDKDNVTDIFYRLIHRFDSGGHINKWSKDEFIKLVSDNNFKLIDSDIWEDDWLWFDKCFDLNYNKCSISMKEKHYLFEVFKKEFTAEKGYIYGHEYIFRGKL